MDLIYNFSQNTSTLPVNLTGVQEMGLIPSACIQSNEVLHSMHTAELLFGFMCFLLFADLVFTILQWRDNQKRRLDSHDSD